jgi:hypothetical protein
MARNFPKATLSRRLGNSGLNKVSSIINDDFGWIFRKVDQGDDFGIDAFADVVNEHGEVTGQSIAIQIKFGGSYFKSNSARHVAFYLQDQHINYYGNLANQIIIILGSKNENLIWFRFCVDDLEKTRKGWKIEINKNSIFDVSAKEAILELLGQPKNIKAEAEENWAFSELIGLHSHILYTIDAEDITDCNITNLVHFVNRLTRNKKVAQLSQGKLELYTPAFDNDKRELWEIPEMVRWIRATESANIPWFFLCNTEPPCMWLPLYFAALTEGIEAGRATNSLKREIINISMPRDKILILLESNFTNLNKICDRYQFTEMENKSMTFASMKAIGLNFDI